MSAYSTYQPINCAFHDVLESVAVLRTPALIHFLDDDGVAASLQSRIADVYSHDGAEFLRLPSGERIRLDQLLSIDGVQLASFPKD